MSSDGAPITVFSREFDPTSISIAVIASQFNTDVTDRLVAGAIGCLTEYGLKPESIEVIRVPGAWELPQVASLVLRLDRYDAIVTLGCVIRGETPHFDYVCSAANDGIAAVAREASIPILFGVLTTDDWEQALARAGEGSGNKGYEAAVAALQMVDLYARLAGN
ncbi:MAG: 6,7-dimethyl-8-ribityllumazine synthase [Gemmatimonadetes bacterium]|nr:6,7-dimethyl-8-ribityllumazine synthase [Gemmatimonadota bacterium]|tara:strand:- start:174 stop:665 length:492 start_codon:yes stop_codon:yes gene_type:complete